MFRHNFVNKSKEPPDFMPKLKNIIEKIEGEQGPEIFNNLPGSFFEEIEAFRAQVIKKYEEYKSKNQIKLFYKVFFQDLLKFTRQNDGLDKYRCPLCGFASTNNGKAILINKPIMKRFLLLNINFAKHSALYGYEIEKNLKISDIISETQLASPINEIFKYMSRTETKEWKVYKESVYHDLQVTSKKTFSINDQKLSEIMKMDKFNLLFDNYKIDCSKQNDILMNLLESTRQKEFFDATKCLKQKQYANTDYITQLLYILSITHTKEMIEFTSKYQEEDQHFFIGWKNLVNTVYEQYHGRPYIPSDPQQQTPTKQSYLPVPIFNRKTEDTEKGQEINTPSSNCDDSYQEPISSESSLSFGGQNNDYDDFIGLNNLMQSNEYHNNMSINSVPSSVNNNFESTALSLLMSQEVEDNVSEVTDGSVNENDYSETINRSSFNNGLYDLYSELL